MKFTQSLELLFRGCDDGAAQRECISCVRMSTQFSCSSRDKLLNITDAFLHSPFGVFLRKETFWFPGFLYSLILNNFPLSAVSRVCADPSAICAVLDDFSVSYDVMVCQIAIASKATFPPDAAHQH